MAAGVPATESKRHSSKPHASASKASAATYPRRLHQAPSSWQCWCRDRRYVTHIAQLVWEHQVRLKRILLLPVTTFVQVFVLDIQGLCQGLPTQAEAEAVNT